MVSSRTPTSRLRAPLDSAEARTQQILKALSTPSVKYYALLGIAAAGILWFLTAWSFQLKYGLIVTDLADWGTSGGVPWGMYIGSFIWWVGIAHGGIIISASVRLFKLHVFKPITRLAELLTISALTVAGLYIILDLGRPDRVVTSILAHYAERVHYSPLVWDVTVITLYFIMSGTYLLLTLRNDIFHLQNRLPKTFAPVYKALLIDHNPDENKKINGMVWWLAFGVIILAPLLLHGGVIPWLFQLLPSMPGWYSAIQGPQFLTIALTSAVGSVIFVAYIFRRIFGWNNIIPDKTFSRLGAVLALFALFFLWLQLQQIVTGLYAPSEGLGHATEAKVTFLPFWLAIGTVAAAMIYLTVQVIFPKLFSVVRTVIAGFSVVMAVMLEKVLFVVEGLAHPAFRYYEGVPGEYFPTWIELSSLIGAISIVMLFFTLAAKVIPVVEVIEEEEH